MAALAFIWGAKGRGEVGRGAKICCKGNICSYTQKSVSLYAGCEIPRIVVVVDIGVDACLGLLVISFISFTNTCYVISLVFFQCYCGFLKNRHRSRSGKRYLYFANTVSSSVQ